MAVRNQRLKKRLLRGLPVLAALSVILASLVLVSDVEQGSEAFSRQYIWVLSLTVAALVMLVLAIMARAISLGKRIRSEAPGARLSARWVRNFLLLSIPPALIVYFFSAYFLTRTVDGWFDVEVETALADSLALGQEFLDNRTLEVRNRLQEISFDIEGLENDPDALRRAMLRQISASGPTELTMLGADGQIVATVNFDLLEAVSAYPSDFALVQATERGEYAAAETGAQGGLVIRVLRQLPAEIPGDPDVLLQAIFPLPDNITGLTETIQQEYHRYQNISYLADSLKQSFLLILTLVVALTILLAILAALNTARRMVSPISNLAEGTRKVAGGDLTHAVQTRDRDELDFLARSFNEMTEALLKASEEAEQGRARLQAQGEYLETVLGSISAGVLTLDNDLQVVRANRAAEQVLNLPPAYLGGRDFEQIVETAPFLAPLTDTIRLKAASERQEWQQEVRLDRSGARTILLVRGSRLPGEAGEGGHVIVFDDVTVLNQAQRDAAWAEVARRLAHEVKNPLTPIRLAAERLRMKLMDRLDARDGELLDKAAGTIVSQVEALRTLVDAFGDYAAEPRMDRNDLDFERLIREVASLYREGDPGLSLDLELVPGPPGLSADGGQLRQLLHNLIRNATEAVPEGESASIQIRSSVTGDGDQDWLELEVSDRGPGFPESVLEKPFEPYVTHKANGSGLGLAICRKIVENHDGRIHLGNHEQQGARIQIRLPLNRPSSRGLPQRDTA